VTPHVCSPSVIGMLRRNTGPANRRLCLIDNSLHFPD
jgi:hypothetical protein